MMHILAILKKIKGIAEAHCVFLRKLTEGIYFCFDVSAEELLREGKHGGTRVCDVRKIAIAVFDEQFHLSDKFTGFVFKKHRTSILSSTKKHLAFMDSENEFRYKDKLQKLRRFMEDETALFELPDQMSKEQVLELFRYNGMTRPLVPKF